MQKDSEIASQKHEDKKKKTPSLPQPSRGLWKFSVSKSSPSFQAAPLSSLVSSKYLPKGSQRSQLAPDKNRNGLVEKEIQKNLLSLSDDLSLNNYDRVSNYFQQIVFRRNHTFVEEKTSGTSSSSRAGNRHNTSRNPTGDDVDNRTQFFPAIEVNDLPMSNMTLDLFSASTTRSRTTHRRRATRSVTSPSELDRVQPWRRQARTLPLEVQKRLRAVFDRTGDTPQFRSLVDRAVAQYGSLSINSVAHGEEGQRPRLNIQQQAAPKQEHRTRIPSQPLDVPQPQQLQPQQLQLQRIQQQQPQQLQLLQQPQRRQKSMQDQQRQQQPRTQQIHQQHSDLAQQQQQQLQRLDKQQPQKQRNFQLQPLKQQDLIRYRLQQQLQEQRLSHQQRRAQQHKTFSDLGNVTLAAELTNTSDDNVSSVGSNGHLNSTFTSLSGSSANTRPILPTTDRSTRRHHDHVEGQLQGQNVLKQDALSPSATSSSHSAKSSAPAMLADPVTAAYEVTSLPSSVTQTTTQTSETMLLSSVADSLGYQNPQKHSQPVEEMPAMSPKAVNTILAKDVLPNSNVATGIQSNILKILGPLAGISTHQIQTLLSTIQRLSEGSLKNLSAGVPSIKENPDGNLTHVPLGTTEAEREIISRMPGHVAQNATLRRLFLDMAARAKQQAQEARRRKKVKEIPAVTSSPLQTQGVTAGQPIPALTESPAAAPRNSSVMISSPQSPPVIILPANFIPSEGSIERLKAFLGRAISQQLPVWSEHSLQSALIQALRESSSLTVKGQRSSLMLEGFPSALDAVAVTTSAPVATTPSRTLLEPAITFILSLPESSLRNLQSHSSSIETLLQPMIAATAGSGETLPSKIDQFKLALYDTLTSDPKSYVLVTNQTRWQARYKREDGGPTILVEELMSGYLSGIVDMTKVSATLTPVLEFTWMFEAGTVPGTANEAVERVLARFGRKSTTSSTTSAITSTTQNPMMPSTKITAFSVASDKTSQTSTPSPLWTASQTTPRQQQQRKVQTHLTTPTPVTTMSSTTATLSSVMSPWSTTGRESIFMPSSPKVKESSSISEKVNFHTTALPTSPTVLSQQPATQPTSRTTTSKLGITEISFSSSTQVPPSLTSIVNLDKPLMEKDTGADVKTNDDEVSQSPLALTSVSAPFQTLSQFHSENVNPSGHIATSVKSDNSFSNLQEADEQTAQTNSDQQSPEYFDTTTTVPFTSVFQKNEDADGISQRYTTVSWLEPFKMQHSSTSQLPPNSQVTNDRFPPDFSSSSLLSDPGNRMSEFSYSVVSLPLEGRPLKITTHSSISGDSQMPTSPSPQLQTFVTLVTPSAISSTASSTVKLDKHSIAFHSSKQSSTETRQPSSSLDTGRKYSQSQVPESSVSLLLGSVTRSPVLDSNKLSSGPVIRAPYTEIPPFRRLVDVTYGPPANGFLDDGRNTLTAVSDVHGALPTADTLKAVSNSLTSSRSAQPERDVQLLVTPQQMNTNRTEPTTSAINRHNSTFFGLKFEEFMAWLQTNMPSNVNPAAPSMTSTKTTITTKASTTVPTTSTRASTTLPPVCPLNEAVKCGPRARRTNRLAALCELKCDLSTATCDLSLCQCFCVPTTGQLSLQLAPKRQLTTGTATAATTSTPGQNTTITTENPEQESESESE